MLKPEYGPGYCPQTDIVTCLTPEEWLLPRYDDGQIQPTTTNFSPAPEAMDGDGWRMEVVQGWRWSRVRPRKTTHQNDPHAGQKIYDPQTCLCDT